MIRDMKWALAAVGAAGAAVISAMAYAQSNAPRPEQDTAWLNQQAAALAERHAEDGWVWMDGGLRWRRVAGDGTGPKPSVRDIITLHYAGTLVDGTEFDSSYRRNQPATFPLGQLIPAWQMAVPHMSVGDTFELAVPADLGYGPRGQGPIPGGATLLFKIELLGIRGR